MPPKKRRLKPSIRLPDLPYEIWEYITSFFPAEEVLKLLPVNHILFNIAMNQRYRTRTISSLSYGETRRNLEMLTNPSIASRVQTLKFEPGPICYLLMEDQVVGLQYRASGGLSREQKIIAAANLSTIMHRLNSLITLSVDLSKPHYEYFQQIDPPFFRIGWTSFRHSLRVLELRVPIETMASILPDLSEGIVDNLDEVSLDIMRATPTITQSEDVMLATIVPFLTAHCHLLRSLTLDVAERTDLSPLFNSLILPKLTNFKLKQPFFREEDADYTGLRQFFKNHRLQLQSFEIFIGFPMLDSGSPPYAIFAQRCFLISLPHLRNLVIGYDFNDRRISEVARNSFIQYVHSSAPTLVSLRLYPRLLNDSVKRLLVGLRNSTSLSTLKIGVDFLNTEPLVALVDNLPYLQSLHLTYAALAPHFIEELGLLDISRWTLHKLDLSWRNDFGVSGHPLKIVGCTTALLRALPNVEFICGRSREEYLKGAHS